MHRNVLHISRQCGLYAGLFDNSAYSITETPISAMFQTKVFDFDYAERRKNIRRLYIGATDTADRYIRLAYITEQGTREDALRLGGLRVRRNAPMDGHAGGKPGAAVWTQSEQRVHGGG